MTARQLKRKNEQQSDDEIYAGDEATSSRRRQKRDIKVRQRALNEDDDDFDELDEMGGDNDDEGSWECTVCTFRNRSEAFKCAMCESRKGTSTRKPRLTERASANIDPLALQAQKAALEAVEQQRHKRHRQKSVAPIIASQSPESEFVSPQPKRSSVPRRIVRNTTSRDRYVDRSDDEDDDPYKLDSLSDTPPKQPQSQKHERHSRSSSQRLSDKLSRIRRNGDSRSAFLANQLVDANSARTMTVTVDGVTVVITDYKPAGHDSLNN